MRRTAADGAATTLAVISTILVVAPLVAIFAYLIFKGASSLNLAFFTQAPKPVEKWAAEWRTRFLDREFCWVLAA